MVSQWNTPQPPIHLHTIPVNRRYIEKRFNMENPNGTWQWLWVTFIRSFPRSRKFTTFVTTTIVVGWRYHHQPTPYHKILSDSLRRGPPTPNCSHSVTLQVLLRPHRGVADQVNRQQIIIKRPSQWDLPTAQVLLWINQSRSNWNGKWTVKVRPPTEHTVWV